MGIWGWSMEEWIKTITSKSASLSIAFPRRDHSDSVRLHLSSIDQSRHGEAREGCQGVHEVTALLIILILRISLA